jgi:hypothetical protein
VRAVRDNTTLSLLSSLDDLVSGVDLVRLARSRIAKDFQSTGQIEVDDAGERHRALRAKASTTTTAFQGQKTSLFTTKWSLMKSQVEI